MKRRTKRAEARDKRRLDREMGMARPSGESNYGRKKKWLARNGVFGFEVREPKPWRTTRRRIYA